MLLAGGVVIAVSAGVSVSAPSAGYSAAVRQLGTTIGVGPSLEGLGLTIPLPFYGNTVPEGDSFHTLPYPAQMTLSLPIISDIPGLSDIPYWPQSMKRSESIGAGYLLQDIAATPAGDKVTIIGLSQGSMVAEIARTEMAKVPDYVANAQNYEFIFIGDPYQPNGGLLTRFTDWNNLPVLGDIFPFGRPGPSDSPFKTTYYQNQYDGIVDFPAYYNPLAIANQVAGMAFGHAFPGYVLEHPDAPNAVSTQVGNTTYVMLPQYLPLLAPLRIPASLIGAERFVDFIDPVLRVFVEMGYDRTADPSHVKAFSWATPDEKRQEALDALPGAFAQSLAILGGETYNPSLPQPVVSDIEAVTPVTEHPVEPVDTSPMAQGVRRIVVDVTRAVSDATRPLAKVLQAIGRGTANTKVDDKAEADNEPESTPFNRRAQARFDSRHTDSAQRRLKADPDADRFAKRNRHAGRPGASSGTARSDRASARAPKPAARQAAKSAHTQRSRPSKHASARAG
ncbi:PE-PPE domain-containing protein [Mycolicibacterium sp. XJ870]